MDLRTKHLETVCHFLPMKSRRPTPMLPSVLPEYLVDKPEEEMCHDPSILRL